MRAKRGVESTNLAFLRLLHVAREAQATGGLTVVLGAGCSLSSSSDPLTTESIARGWVEQFSPRDEVKSWPMDRVWTEFVQSWDNLGHADRTRYLSARLLAATPGPGYGYLADLVSAKYIRHIVTTNFDLLLDRSLVGIPSCFRVGVNPPVQRSGSSPLVEVLKVHGDISSPPESASGPLRFSPRELEQLPAELLEQIRIATSGPTIVMGYSGADRGFMRSLARNSDHTAFWVVPDGYALRGFYTGSEASEWLRARRAEDNIIDGPSLGFFDTFMEELAASLIGGRPGRARDYTALPAHWLDTPVYRELGKNFHLKRVASIFLELLDSVLHGQRWHSSRPPFATSHAGLTAAAAALFRDLPLPTVVGGVPRNEVDALLLLLAVEVRSRSAGLDMPAIAMLRAVADEFSARYEAYEPHASFWRALDFLVADVAPPLPSDTLEMRLNCQRRLILIVHSTPLAPLRILLDLVDVLRLLYAPLAPDAVANLPVAALYRAFQECSDIEVHEGKLQLRIAGLTQGAFRQLNECLLNALPHASLREAGDAVEMPLMHVDFVPGTTDPTSFVAQPSHLYELVEQRSLMTCDGFLARGTPLGLPSARIIRRAHDDEIEKFLHDSSKSAAILAGQTGSGKSTSVANLIKQERSRLGYLVVFTEGASLAAFDPLESAFPELASDGGSNASMEARLAAAVRAHKRKLLLVVDALNEVSVEITQVKKYWTALLRLAKRLVQLDDMPIKLLVTCREGTLKALSKSHPPTSQWFQGTSETENEASPWIAVQRLTIGEVESLVDANLGPAAPAIVAELRKNPELLKLYSRPFWLAVVSKEIGAGRSIAMLRNPRVVVGRVCDELIAHAISDEDDMSGFRELLEVGFAETAIRPADKAHNFGFAAKRVFGWERQDRYQQLHRKLVDVGIVLAPSQNVLTEFRFAHDLIEEHLLGQFLLQRLTAGREDAACEELLRQCMPGEYFGNGLEALLSVLDDEQSAHANPARAQLVVLVDLLRARAGGRVAEIMVSAFENRTDVHTDVKLLLGMSGSAPAEHRSMLTFFSLSGMHSILERGREFIPSRLSSAFSDVLRDAGSDAVQRAEVELVRSTCAYRQDLFSSAFQYAESARRLAGDTAGADYGLIDRADRQIATLLSKKGDKLSAVKLLEGVYARCHKQRLYSEAFETGLELGAIYRDMSDFERALELYADISAWATQVTPFLRYRLLLQSATAKKNKLQKVTEPARYAGILLSDEECRLADRLCHEAISEIEEVQKWAEDHESPHLLLICASEYAECLLVMAYLKSELIPQCEDALAHFRALLERHPLVTRRVEHYREMARLEEIKSEEDGVDHLKMQHRENAILALRAGRDVARKHGLLYQVSDCDYQMARFCARALKATGSSSFFHEGMDAIASAIMYYESNEFGDRHYLVNAKDVRSRLQEIGADLGFSSASEAEGRGQRRPEGRGQ